MHKVITASQRYSFKNCLKGKELFKCEKCGFEGRDLYDFEIFKDQMIKTINPVYVFVCKRCFKSFYYSKDKLYHEF